ncbi:MAG TPA: 50S ribosomal protein L11 methyltransferase, partial [Anaerolineae bacterium]|nr:50S ribosomal protein L11 methyltransferase [Anaerolineae bacterium]
MKTFWRRATRRAKRGFLTMRFQLFQRHRYGRLVLERIDGRPFVVLPQVFNPALFEASAFLARMFDLVVVRPEASVLDLGTGSGVGAVFAAQHARRVTATDINSAAVRCARINALLNHVEDRVEVLEGDLFAP